MLYGTNCLIWKQLFDNETLMGQIVRFSDKFNNHFISHENFKCWKSHLVHCETLQIVWYDPILILNYNILEYNIKQYVCRSNWTATCFRYFCPIFTKKKLGINPKTFKH